MASVRLGGTANLPADPGGDVGSRGIESSGTRQASTVAANGEVSCQLLPDARTPRSNPIDRPSNRTESCFSIGVETMPVGVMTDDLWNAVATSRGTRPAPPPSLAVAAADISRALVLRSYRDGDFRPSRGLLVFGDADDGVRVSLRMEFLDTSLYLARRSLSASLQCVFQARRHSCMNSIRAISRSTTAIAISRSLAARLATLLSSLQPRHTSSADDSTRVVDM